MRKPPPRRSLADGGYPVPFDPKLPAAQSPALWRAELVPDAVILVSAPKNFETAASLDIAALPTTAIVWQGDGGQHIILTDSQGDHRLWLADAGHSRQLAVLLPLDDDFPIRAEGAARLYRRLIGARAGAPPRRLALTNYQRSRFIAMLRAIDARRSGASYRDIAIVLFDPDVAHLPAQEWKISAAHSRVFRLVKDANALIEGAYRGLLRGD